MHCVHRDDSDENAGNIINHLHAAMVRNPIKTTWLNSHKICSGLCSKS